jgi:LPS-assembly lipoprotein
MKPLHIPAGAARRRVLRAGLAGTAVALLAGCGFRLRGSGVQLAFASLRLNARSDSAVVQDLRSQLETSGVRVLDVQPVAAGQAPEVPDVVLDVLQDQRERVVVGSTAAGQVRELQLRWRFRFRLRTVAGKDLIPEVELLQERDLSFTETQVLGKADEEELLYRDMRDATVRQVMARLAAVRSL